jgi:hypothetical protein
MAKFVFSVLHTLSLISEHRKDRARRSLLRRDQTPGRQNPPRELHKEGKMEMVKLVMIAGLDTKVARTGL